MRNPNVKTKREPKKWDKREVLHETLDFLKDIFKSDNFNSIE